MSTHTVQRAAPDGARAILDRTFGRLADIDFTIRLPDGTLWPADPVTNPSFTLVLNNARALRELFLHSRDDLAAGEAYMRGDLDIEGDIEAAVRAADSLRGLRPSARDLLQIGLRTAVLRRTDHAFDGGELHLHGRRHSRRRDRTAVRYHYDVSNEFYAAWLDSRMVYTCAYFATPDQDLDTAQLRKLDHICRKLRLRPGQHLLDIGCGWGALIIHAAREYGVEALGITLSEPQARLARERIREAGLDGRVRVDIRDYRELDGAAAFDAIASVGMFEHVGAMRAPEYFERAWRLLRPGGIFLNHAIAGTAGRETEPTSAFSARYVFPDHDLVPIGKVLRIAEQTGFEVRDLENLREHYALTLRHWVRRMEANHETAAAAAGEATYRAWRLVLAGAAYRFTTGDMSLQQALLLRPTGGVSGLPLTRDDWYRPAPNR